MMLKSSSSSKGYHRHHHQHHHHQQISSDDNLDHHDNDVRTNVVSSDYNNNTNRNNDGDDNDNNNEEGNTDMKMMVIINDKNNKGSRMGSSNDDDDDYNDNVFDDDDNDDVYVVRGYPSSTTTIVTTTKRLGEYGSTPIPPNDDDDDHDDDDIIIHPHPSSSSAYQTIDIEDAIDRIGMGTFQRLIILSCGLCFAADAMEILLLSFLAVILQSEWNLQERQTDAIISVVFVGAMIGTITLSTLADQYGRRPIFALTASIISVFGIGTAFCTTYPQLLFVRSLVGFGVGGLTVPYDALSEFIPTYYRGKNVLSTSFFWTGGSLLVPLLAWWTLDTNNNNSAIGGTMMNTTTTNEDGWSSSSSSSWRGFIVLCAVPSVISAIIGIFLVPESPRWLLTKGKADRALWILRRASATNGKDPLVTFPPGTVLVDYNNNHRTGSSSCDRDDDRGYGEITTATTVTSPSLLTSSPSPSLSRPLPPILICDADGDGAGLEMNSGHNQRLHHRQRLPHYDDENSTENHWHSNSNTSTNNIIITRHCQQLNTTQKKNDDCWILCSTAQWRRLSVLVSGQWFGLAFLYYGAIITVSIVFSDSGTTTTTSDGTTPPDDTNVDTATKLGTDGYDFDYMALLISSSAEVIGLIMAICIVDPFGRVRTQAYCYVSGGLCVLILGQLDMYVSGDVDSMDDDDGDEGRRHGGRWHLILFAFLARMFMMSATTVTWLHTSEMLPTEIRSTGHGLANAMGRVGGLCSPFIITASTSLRTIGIVVFLMSIVTACFCINLPETAGRAMGDISIINDNNNGDDGDGENDNNNNNKGHPLHYNGDNIIMMTEKSEMKTLDTTTKRTNSSSGRHQQKQNDVTCLPGTTMTKMKNDDYAMEIDDSSFTII